MADAPGRAWHGWVATSMCSTTSPSIRRIPTSIYVSAWSSSSQQIGEIFRTRDGGANWQTLPAMHGKSIRAMAMFKGNSNVLVAGALDGVYRSKDGGDTWEHLSPANSAEIKNIESIAVDPKDPNTVYAGTWHLAWKTSDGGANWQHINKGMIDDSDVFSVIVDHDNPSVVFASACSGIYKSETGGNLFDKVKGIPFSARRTRVLKQDPTNENIVYAGTTEGLWKTVDLGKVWKRVTSSRSRGQRCDDRSARFQQSTACHRPQRRDGFDEWRHHLDHF